MVVTGTRAPGASSTSTATRRIACSASVRTVRVYSDGMLSMWSSAGYAPASKSGADVSRASRRPSAAGATSSRSGSTAAMTRLKVRPGSRRRSRAIGVRMSVMGSAERSLCTSAWEVRARDCWSGFAWPTASCVPPAPSSRRAGSSPSGPGRRGGSGVAFAAYFKHGLRAVGRTWGVAAISGWARTPRPLGDPLARRAEAEQLGVRGLGCLLIGACPHSRA